MNLYTPQRGPFSERKSRLLNPNEIIILKTKISELEQCLKQAEEEIIKLNRQIIDLQHILSDNSDTTKPGKNSLKNNASDFYLEVDKNTVKKHFIYILGDESLKGLSAAMLNSRSGK